MAKKDKNKDRIDDNQDEILDEKDGAGSKIVTALIVLVIVVIWLGIFGVLIKLDVGNFGSNVLYPILKDVPVLNQILPDTAADENYSGTYNFDTVGDAVTRIKELESELAASKSTNEADASQIKELQSQVDQLQVYKTNQDDFSKRVKEFDEQVVFADQAPDVEEYKKFYEGINAENAEKIYQQVVSQLEYTQEIKSQADIYSKMDAAKAAPILSTMTSDLDTLASIMDSMSESKSAAILAEMDTNVAAQITKKMISMKK